MDNNNHSEDYTISVLVSETFYPEGPFYKDGALYYVEYSTSRVMKYDDSESGILWENQGCGPASLIETGESTLLVSCYDSNSIAEISFDGNLIKKWDQDTEGNSFTGPNDFINDSSNGIYFSTSGVFDTSAPVQGKVFYLSSTGDIIQAAENLDYPNGLIITQDEKYLLVNEHLAKQITRFQILDQGSLGQKEVFIRLDDMVEPPLFADDYTGPDGITMDNQGNLYVCQYGASRILVFNNQGLFLHDIPFPDRYITNAAFGESDDILYVTAATDAWNEPYPGKVYRVDISW